METVRERGLRVFLVVLLSLVIPALIPRTATANLDPGSMDYATMGYQGEWGNPGAFGIGTNASLHTCSETVPNGTVKVCSLYVIDVSTGAWAETGWATDRTISPNEEWCTFLTYNSGSTGYHDPPAAHHQLPVGEWRYYEVNRFQGPDAQGRYEYRFNLGGTGYYGNVWLVLPKGQSVVSSERETLATTNYLVSKNCNFRGTSGGWYRFNDHRILYKNGDPGYWGHWGSFYGPNRDFVVNTTL